MARRIVRWLTPSTAAAALAVSQAVSTTFCPLSAVHCADRLSIAGIASPKLEEGTSERYSPSALLCCAPRGDILPSSHRARRHPGGRRRSPRVRTSKEADHG